MVEEPPVDEVDRSEWSDERLQLEEDYRQAEAGQRFTDTTDSDELERVTWELLETAEELRERFQEVIDRGEPEPTAWALVLVGQGFVIFGCNLARSPALERLSAEQQEDYQRLLDEQADEFRAVGRQLFDQAVEIEPETDDEVDDQLQLWRWRADQWNRDLAQADGPRDGCEAVEAAWRIDAVE